MTGLLAACAALVSAYRQAGPTGTVAAVGAVVVDRPALFLQGVTLLVATLGLLLIAERTTGRQSGTAGSG